jgi:hypothetical protein
MSSYLVAETRLINSAPQTLFDIVADPAMHPVIDGSGSVRAVVPGGPVRLAKGVKFAMDMKLGASYKIMNTVIEFEEPSLIAWRHFNGHIWRYRFEAVDGATLVTEEWDARATRNRLLLRLLRFPRRNRLGMRETLRRLAERVAS